MNSNFTTLHVLPTKPTPATLVYYTLIPFVLLTLIGCVVAMVFYIRRKARLDELRHRLIPLYTYDPAEDRDDWEDASSRGEEEELVEPLYKDGKLSFASGVSLHSSGPCWFLISVLLTVALLLPVLTRAVLLCNICPLDYIGKPCYNMTTECAPGRRCFSAKAYYGTIHLLSAQGCMTPELCGSYELVSHLGVRYNVSYACCCKDKCNNRPKANRRLLQLLGFATSDSEDGDAGNQTNTSEDLWDSCMNSTTFISPVNASS